MRRNTYSVLRVTVIDRVSEACKFILVLFARRTVSEAERRYADEEEYLVLRVTAIDRVSEACKFILVIFP